MEVAVRTSYSENMGNVRQALLAVCSLHHSLESTVLPTWAPFRGRGVLLKWV